MQRIDENTYIDETLVTCAEYQLFIDEMREQGKYYQPDHWTSYQFPMGQAQEAIVGVRHSDAAAFCEWLANHDKEKCQYRLPTVQEAKAVLMEPSEQEVLGYWLFQASEFAWIRSVRNRVQPYDLDDDLQSKHEFTLNEANTILHNLEQECTGARAYADSIRNKLPEGKQIADHVRSVCERASSLIQGQFTRISLNEFAGSIGDADRYTRKLADHYDYVFQIYHEPYRGTNYDPFGGREDFGKIRIFLLDCKERVDGLSNVLDGVELIDRAVGRTLDLDDIFKNVLYQDFSQLQERISRRSPAFEGIRLVKERMK